MDLRQLRYYQAIVTAGTISGAAKKLFVTQPSLSQQLHSLEEELGVKLVDRGSRKLSLTEAGQLLYERSSQIIDLLSTTTRELKELHDGHKGTIAIGTIASAGATLLPGVIRAFHQRFPGVRFQLFEGDTPRIIDLLTNGLIEFGIIRSVFNTEFYHSIDLPPEPFVVASTQQYNERSDTVTIADLASKALLVHRSNEAMILECCRKAGFEPDIFCKGDDVRSLLALADEGVGTAVVPKSAVGLVPRRNITYSVVTDSELYIKKSIIWMRQRYMTVAARQFINEMLSVQETNR